MSVVKIITAPPRSGKLRTALDSVLPLIRENRCSEILILVPSNPKASEIRNCLLREKGLTGFLDLKILTFLDLTFKAFEDSPLPGKVSAPLTRRWMIQSLLEVFPLRYLKKVRETRGIVQLALDFIRTFKEAGIPPEELQKTAPAAELTPALMDMAAIYAAYEEERRRRGLLDREDLFPLAAAQFQDAPSHPFSRLRRVLITGFYDFTPLQMELITALAGIKTVEQFTLTLLHPEGSGPAHAFTGRTLDRLLTFLPGAEVVSRKRKEQKHDHALDRLSRFSPASPGPAGRVPADPGIEIFNTPGCYREVEEIARKIRGLIRDSAYHFKDFAVAFRNLNDYRDKIVEVFRFYRISCHLASGSPLRSNPLVQTLMGILETPGSGYRREAVTRLLRSPYIRFAPLAQSTLSAERLDSLAREAMIHGSREEWKNRIRARREHLRGRLEFLEAGSMESNDPERRARRIIDSRKKLGEYEECGKIVENLMEALDPLRQSASVKEFVETLNDLMQRFDMEHRIYGTDDLRLIRRDQAALKKFREILQQIVENYEVAHSRTRLRDVIPLLNLALSETTYTPDRPGEDSVLVTDVQGMRELHRPVVFIGGLVEESFPRLHSPNPVFGEDERAYLNKRFAPKRWVPLAAHWREEEDLLFILTAAAAAERLILTYPRTDSQGRDLLPSRYIEQIRSLFTEDSVSPHEFSLKETLPEPGEIFRNKELLEYTFRGLHRPASDGPHVPLLLRYLLENQEGKIHALLHGLHVIKARREGDPEYTGRLGAKTAARIRREEGPYAVTALEKYGSCPFLYFCERELKLRPVEEVEDEIGVMDIGSLYHRILERFYKEIGGAVTSGNIGQCRETMRRVAERTLSHAEYKGIPGHEKLWEIRKEEVHQVLSRFVEKEQEEYIRMGEVPAHFEVSFGMGRSTGRDPLSTVEPLVIDSANGPIRIMGKVDRIDFGEEKKPLFSIVDYKTGKGSPSLSSILRGESLQLPVYAHWVEKTFAHARIFHSASFYLLRSGEKKTRIPGKENSWEEIREISRDFIRNYVESIRRGEFPVTEKKCHAYCTYHSICRIREE